MFSVFCIAYFGGSGFRIQYLFRSFPSKSFQLNYPIIIKLSRITWALTMNCCLYLNYSWNSDYMYNIIIILIIVYKNKLNSSKPKLKHLSPFSQNPNILFQLKGINQSCRPHQHSLFIIKFFKIWRSIHWNFVWFWRHFQGQPFGYK